ncbi:zinc transporter binding subunit ZevA [Pasteurellaceae bacterium 22721_9_1]
MKKILFFFTALFMWQQTALAHPHAFISMQTKPLVENNQLIGFSLQWLLDEASSAEVLYDFQLAQDDEKAKKEMAENIIKNVIAEHYFSYLYDKKGNKVKYTSQPKNYGLKAVGNQIAYYFDFFLSKPQALVDNQLTFMVYDPTYYVAMFYDAQSAVDFSPLPSNCEGKLIHQQVDEKTEKYASSLDKTQKEADFSLGVLFAQKVIIQCK